MTTASGPGTKLWHFQRLLEHHFQNTTSDTGKPSENHKLISDVFAAELFKTPDTTNSCPLDGLASFLIELLGSVCKLVALLVDGKSVTEYLEAKILACMEEDDGSDLSIVQLLQKKHSSLKYISRELESALDRCQAQYRKDILSEGGSRIPSTTLPNGSATVGYDVGLSSLQLLSQAAEHQESTTFPAGPTQKETFVPLPYDQNPTHNNKSSTLLTMIDDSSSSGSGNVNDNSSHRLFSTSPPGPEPPPETTSTSLDDRFLTSRGKGHYVCPHGLSCTKGGVQSDGTLVVFERNSAFRAHKAKHEKSFRCDIPGCTNTKGFARLDQLERHKRTTRHGAPPPTIPSLHPGPALMTNHRYR